MRSKNYDLKDIEDLDEDELDHFANCDDLPPIWKKAIKALNDAEPAMDEMMHKSREMMRKGAKWSTKPEIGSILRVKSKGTYGYRTGIYTGQDEIVTMLDGIVQDVTIDEFLLGNAGDVIEIACYDTDPLFDKKFADRAMYLARKRYKFDSDVTCHTVTASFILGIPVKDTNLKSLRGLENVLREKFSMDEEYDYVLWIEWATRNWPEWGE